MKRTSPADRQEGLTLAALALVIRLIVVGFVHPEPVWDGRYFDVLARHLAAGDGYVAASEASVSELHPTAHYPVGFPALLALVYRIFGTHVGVGFALQCVLGAAVVAAVHRIVLRAHGPASARGAGLIVALHPGLVLQATLLMAEPLAALLYALLIAWMAGARPGPLSSRRALFVGGVAGLATLVRPQTLLLAPALMGVTFFREKSRAPTWNGGIRKALLPSAAFAFGLLAVVLPWSARNARVLDGPALVSTNGGWNLAIGALPGATGRYRALPDGHGCEAEAGEVHVDRCLAGKAREAILADPLHFIALVPAKLSYAIDYEAFPIEALHAAHPEQIGEGVRRAGWRVLMVVHQALLLGAAVRVFRRRGARTIALGALVALVPVVALGRPSSGGVALALAGALATGSSRLERLLGMTILVFLGTHAVFFGEDRYHVVIEPLLAVVFVGL